MIPTEGFISENGSKVTLQKVSSLLLKSTLFWALVILLPLLTLIAFCLLGALHFVRSRRQRELAPADDDSDEDSDEESSATHSSTDESSDSEREVEEEEEVKEGSTESEEESSEEREEEKRVSEDDE